MNRRKTNENLADMAGSAEADNELQMARSQLYKIAQYAIKLHEMTKQITDPNGLEPWQQAKLTKASDYLSAVYHNIEYSLKYKPNGDATGELGAAPGEIAVGESKKKYGKMKETSDPYHKELRNRLRLKEASSILELFSEDGNRSGGSMGGPEKRDFKRRELEKELGNKKQSGGSNKSAPHYILINGKMWASGGKPKEFNGFEEARQAFRALKAKYPDKQVQITTKPTTG
jgi:hypothetical protein